MNTNFLGRGFRAAWRQRRLVLLLWVWMLLLALVAAAPLAQWWQRAFAYAPEGDRLLQGFSYPLLEELTQYDRSSVWSVVNATLGSLTLLAMLGNAFVAGGTLEVLLGRAGRARRAVHRQPAADVPVGRRVDEHAAQAHATGAGATGAGATVEGAAGVAVAASTRLAEAEPLLDEGSPPSRLDAVAGYAAVESALAPAAVAVQEPPDLLPATAAAGPPGTGTGGDGPPHGTAETWDAPVVASPGSPPVVTAPPTTAAGDDDDDRPLLHRFFRGGGRFYLRNLVLLAINLLATVVIAGALAALARFATKGLEHTTSSTLAWFALLLRPFVAGVAVVFFALVLDYARIRLVATDTRRVVRGWFGALGFVARHALGTLGLWLGAMLVLLAAAALYLAFRHGVPAGTWPTIALMVLAQQVFTIARTWVRVGLLGAEVEYTGAKGGMEGG